MKREYRSFTRAGWWICISIYHSACSGIARAETSLPPISSPKIEAGNIRLLGVAIYVEDKYLPDQALRVALDQVAILHTEVEATPRLMFCRSFADIQRAQAEDRIGFILTMEGAEPLGDDPHLLQIFHQLGLRMLSLTHARINAAACGGIFAAAGSPSDGLTPFGRQLVAECDRLGILLDLAHINPAGFEEIYASTNRPVLVSHTNAGGFMMWSGTSAMTKSK